ncbi:40S ribosomal protein S8 [Zea mays]|uniref:40S ribosomal protein S8 n=1 Tax=Zea mays TaxID=4577 RepID=A0A1D6Q3W6_MAIZE|nr:40S ribosomal protein S8 [Zea mays]
MAPDIAPSQHLQPDISTPTTSRPGGPWTCSGSGCFRAAGNMVELLWPFLCFYWFREIDEVALFLISRYTVISVKEIGVEEIWSFYWYELGRQPANTKLSSNKTVRRVRVRGGNTKWRALRLDTGNYSWGSEALTRKTRILDVVYNASNNELVRTQTLVKSAIVQVDAAPFKQWYLTHYGVDIGRKKKVHVAKKDDTEFCGLVFQ